MRNIRIRNDVKERVRDYFRCWPGDMDYDAARQGIWRYWRWKKIFLGIGTRRWQVGH